MLPAQLDLTLKQKLQAAATEEGVVVCVFVDRNYGRLLEHWLATAAHAGCRKAVVFCLDKDSAATCDNLGVIHHLVPYQGDWLGFMRHQMLVTRDILSQGFTPIVSDVDAIWLRDPIPYTTSHPHDLVFSPGTLQPREAHEAWGNVLCTGYFMLRPTSAARTMVDHVLPLMETMGDQPAINRFLVSRGLEFEKTDLYPITFRDLTVLQSRAPRFGRIGDLSAALLPNRLIQRLPEPNEPEPLIIHPITPKIEAAKIARLKEIGLWFEDLLQMRKVAPDES